MEELKYQLHTMPNWKKEVKKRVQKLEQLESELQNFHGWAIQITRLTVIKYLCKDNHALCGFALFISEKVEPKIEYREETEHIEDEIEEALHLMQTIYMYNTGTSEFEIKEDDRSQLRDLQREIGRIQNKVKKIGWNYVRTITDMKILMIEEAIDCFLNNDDPKTGYTLARTYTEKYEPGYGTGLIPESLDYLMDIINYWKGYYENIE